MLRVLLRRVFRSIIFFSEVLFFAHINIQTLIGVKNSWKSSGRAQGLNFWGEVVIKNNADAKWLIEEFAFSQGKYELLVNKGLCNISIFDMFQDLYKRQDNKRQNLLFR